MALNNNLSGQNPQWLATLASVTGVGYAILNPQLQFIDKNSNFNRLFLTDETRQDASLMDLLNHIIKDKAFDQNDIEVLTTSLLQRLATQAEGNRQIEWAHSMRSHTGAKRDLFLNFLPDGNVILAITPNAAPDVIHHPQNIDAVMDMGESGYWVYDYASGNFSVHIGKLKNKLDIDEDFHTSQQSIYTLIHPEDLEKARAAVRTVFKTKRQTEITIRLRTISSQTLWVRSRLSLIEDKNGTAVATICHFTNVTQTLRVHNQLRQQAEKTERALHAKNNFLGRMSHEVRTPMNAVIGIADALIHHHGDPKILPKLELIQTSAEKIVTLVDETLQTTKLDEDKIELNPKVSSPRRSVEMTCRLWESKALKAGIELRLEIDPSVPDEMYFDAFRYEQCLNNLISNAVKFTPNGKINVILTTVQKGGHQLVLIVKDNGVGMTPSQQKKVFDPYIQADKTITGKFGGTGLGMYICKSIIELMGGRISLKSSIGKGTIFALTLPIEIVAQKNEEEQSDSLVDKLLEGANHNKSNYSHMRVLVVDDNSTNHLVIGSLLGEVVKDIHYAENGQEALDALEKQTYDFVLMDIHMPVMDGIEATLAIRSSQKPWADTPIIALTADPEYQQKRLCQNIGMNEALSKPIKLTEILEAIDIVFANLSNNTQDSGAFAA